jgi:hypothetical protein
MNRSADVGPGVLLLDEAGRVNSARPAANRLLPSVAALLAPARTE